MTTQVIPAQTIKTCDCCQCTCDLSNSLQEGHMKITAHALDPNNQPCGSAAKEWDLCDSCLRELQYAVKNTIRVKGSG